MASPSAAPRKIRRCRGGLLFHGRSLPVQAVQSAHARTADGRRRAWSGGSRASVSRVAACVVAGWCFRCAADRLTAEECLNVGKRLLDVQSSRVSANTGRTIESTRGVEAAEGPSNPRYVVVSSEEDRGRVVVQLGFCAESSAEIYRYRSRG